MGIYYVNEHECWTASSPGKRKGASTDMEQRFRHLTAPLRPARPGVPRAVGPSCRSWESITEERHATDTMRRTWPGRQGHLSPWSLLRTRHCWGTMGEKEGLLAQCR